MPDAARHGHYIKNEIKRKRTNISGFWQKQKSRDCEIAPRAEYYRSESKVIVGQESFKSKVAFQLIFTPSFTTLVPTTGKVFFTFREEPVWHKERFIYPIRSLSLSRLSSTMCHPNATFSSRECSFFWLVTSVCMCRSEFSLSNSRAKGRVKPKIKT